MSLPDPLFASKVSQDFRPSEQSLIFDVFDTRSLDSVFCKAAVDTFDEISHELIGYDYSRRHILCSDICTGLLAVLANKFIRLSL
jgi:hypothetical protein